MSRIEELIKEFCPDGVEYKKLVDTVTIERGKHRCTRGTNKIKKKF